MLPKYNKNKNKLHLKEDVEKSTKTTGKNRSTDDSGDNTMSSKRAELLFKKTTEMTQK